MSDVRASVLMTSFNGEKYIEEQINSILKSMNDDDELIISDDGSTDNSINIINSISNVDNRVILLNGPRKGLNENIKFLLSNAKGEYIFISDQDDIWNENKINVIIKAFNENPKIDVIHHDSLLVNAAGESQEKTVYESISFSNRLFKFIIKSHIFGSMMAMRRRFVDYDFVPNRNCYDAGIACFAMRKHTILFINDVLMNYRRHENNMSTFKKRKFHIILKERIHLIGFILLKVVFMKKRRKK